jgi:hypothetical protein
MKRTVVALALVAFHASLFAADAIVPIYLSTPTDPSGFVDAAQKDRVRQVGELLKQLVKSKRIRPMDTADAAQVTVVLTPQTEEREERTLGALVNGLNQAAGGLNALKPKEAETRKVRYRQLTLSVGDYQTTLACKDGLARHCSDIILAWIKENQEQLRDRK